VKARNLGLVVLLWARLGIASAVLLIAASARAAMVQSLGNFIPSGVDAANVVGTQFSKGYVYNSVGHTFTAIPNSTVATDVDGDNVVGDWGNQAFIYDLTTKAYTSLIDPLGSQGTEAWGISGSNVAGQYIDAKGTYHGFLYNITTQAYSTLDHPLGAKGTYPTGIDGNNVIGAYVDSSGITKQFLYNGISFTTLNFPSGQDATGISGNRIVGGAGAFIYDINSGAFSYPLTANDFPIGTRFFGFSDISGDTIVGVYAIRGSFGFIATVPEPSSSLLLAVIGAVALALLAIRERYRCRVYAP
jgi:hypothetical protein